ncbi:MAG: folate family ECF transporter S component [Lachnospiraceae bacterium]|nr:folate family ECF transporter S component [Lachnospiraceae bacterium]
MEKKQTTRWSTKSIAMMGLLIALQIVASKYLSIKISDSLRLSIGDSFLLLAGIWFGPVGGMLVGILADILGCVISGMGILPLMTVPPAAVGLLAGLAGKVFRRSKSIWVYGSIIAVISMLTSVLYRSWAFSHYSGAPFISYVGPRFVQACVLVVLNTLVVYKLYHSPVTAMVRGAE